MAKRIIIPIMAITLLVAIAGCKPVPAPSGGTGSSAPTAPVEVVNVGRRAPDFQLQNLDGEVISLRALRGSPVMLNFWATWCPSCVEEMPYLQQIYDTWSDKGLELLTIDLGESPSRVKRFLETNNLSLPTLLDVRQDVTQQYSITGIPTTFFIDKDGIIQAIKVGPFSSKEQIEQYLKKILP